MKTILTFSNQAYWSQLIVTIGIIILYKMLNQLIVKVILAEAIPL